MPDTLLTSLVSSCQPRPIRSDCSKRSTSVENVVMHYCDENGFTGGITTDGYNVYKMFERKDSTIPVMPGHMWGASLLKPCRATTAQPVLWIWFLNFIGLSPIIGFVFYQKMNVWMNADGARFRYLVRFGKSLSLYLMSPSLILQPCSWRLFVMLLMNGKLYAITYRMAGLRLIIMPPNGWWSLFAWVRRTICSVVRRR